MLLILIIFFGFMFLASYVVSSVFLMRLFAKANVPAWKAWVPFVNTWKTFELGGYHGALSFLCTVTLVFYYLAYALVMVNPITSTIAVVSLMVSFLCLGAAIVGFVFYAMAAYQIGLKNGKTSVWVVLFIFATIVWFGILGLGKSRWNDALGKPALGPERPPSYPVNYGGSPQGGYPPQPYYPQQGGGYPPQQSPPPPTQNPY